MELPEFLCRDEHGGIRVTGHRIGLEHVVSLYVEGYSPEMLWEEFPTLPLAVVHKLIAFYLENLEEVEAYITGGECVMTELRATLPRGPSLAELRARLEAKRRAEAHLKTGHIEVV